MEELDSLTRVPNIALYYGFVVIALPFVAGVINRTHWRPFTRWCVAAASCFVASAGYFVVKMIDQGDAGPWNTRHWLTFSLWIVVGAMALYKVFYPAVKDVEQRVNNPNP